MNVTLASPDELTDEHVALWTQFQSENAALDSPYCHFGFTKAVSDVRDRVQVAILDEGGKIVGFFPFETMVGSVGRPVGGRLSDFQGVITRPETCWSAEELVRGCGLSAWDFDRVTTAQTQFIDHACQTHEVAHVDLSGGVERYIREKASDGSGIVRQTERKKRKLEREVGEIRIVADSTDAGLLEELFAWKSAQYQRTKVTDVFAFPWTRELLHNLLTGTDQLRGVLSALFVGDRPVALHYGLQSHGVLHCWFPVFDEQLSRYSPGAILFMELIRTCPEMGIKRVDLGGVSQWKSRLMNRTSLICEGSVDLRPVVRGLRQGLRSTHRWLRNSAFRGPARVPWRVYYHVREWMEFKWLT
jgi:CelD/BcsL family acetyltransferase involved in cellulose biosynthesis